MVNHQKVIIEAHCFPSICFLKTIKPYAKVALEAHESFAKQTFRNRFDILTSNGVQTLNIPLKKSKNNTVITQIEIDYTYKWQNQILKSLKSAYSSSPFFEYYIDSITDILTTEKQYLFELNVEIMRWLKKVLDQNWELEITNSFNKVYIEDADLRGIKQKRKKIDDWKCDNKAYWQVFGNKFAPNLSVLDLIFCEGPLSPKYI